MNITSLNNKINFSERTEAAAADKDGQQTAAAEEQPVLKLNRFDRYEGVSPSDDEKPSYEIVDLSKIKQPELSADMDDTEIKVAVGSLFSQIGMRDHKVPFDSSLDRLHPDAYWARLRLKHQVERSGFNEENIADIAAKVGSEIDRYHSEGKISDELYGRFNDEIKSAVKSFAEELTTIRVTIAEEKEAAHGYATYGFEYNSMRPHSMEEYLLHRLELRRQIEKENPLDFNKFFAKIDQMRFNVTGIKNDSAQKK